MTKMIAAFATDEGKTFMDRHFGDAIQFDIYEINASESHFIKTIENKTIAQQEIHGSGKAAGIAGMLKKENVQILVSKKFGTNINKMKLKFVCMLMNNDSISEALQQIQENLVTVTAEWAKGEERHFLNWKQSQK